MILHFILFLFYFLFLYCIVTHPSYNTYTATLRTRLIDVLTLFIILLLDLHFMLFTIKVFFFYYAMSL